MSKKVELSDRELIELEALSAVLNQKQLADYFGITERTIRNLMDRDENARSAYKKGKSKAIASVGSSLLSNAKSGNVTAQIFYLKTQAGWREDAPDVVDLPELSFKRWEDD